MNYYNDMLKEGDEFQKFVAQKIFEKIAIILDFTDYEHQKDIGETLQGIEVKLDKKFNTTGNLWIEIAEKTNAENVDYVPSGIFRRDNTWLYIIGNYETLFLFGKKTLQRLSKEYSVIENNMMTSRGFLLPFETAEKYAELIIELPVYNHNN